MTNTKFLKNVPDWNLPSCYYRKSINSYVYTGTGSTSVTDWRKVNILAERILTMKYTVRLRDYKSILFRE